MVDFPQHELVLWKRGKECQASRTTTPLASRSIAITISRSIGLARVTDRRQLGLLGAAILFEDLPYQRLRYDNNAERLEARQRRHESPPKNKATASQCSKFVLFVVEEFFRDDLGLANLREAASGRDHFALDLDRFALVVVHLKEALE